MAVFKDDKKRQWKFRGKIKDRNGKWKNYERGWFDTKKAAKAAEDEYRASYQLKEQDVTLNELWARYCRTAEVRESTMIGDQSYYDNHIRPVLGDKQLSELSLADLEEWRMTMRQKEKPGGGKYSTATIKHAKNVLSKTLTYAVEHGLMDYNPCAKLRITETSIKAKSEKIKFWEPPEFQKFVSVIDDPSWAETFEILYESGMREGEYFALRWSDVDFAGHRLKISKSVTNKTRNQRFAVTEPKNANSVRFIDMHENLEAPLRQRYDRERQKDGFTDDFFVSRDFQPMPRQTLANHMDEYIAKSGVSRITPHGLRHSHASHLIHLRIDDSLIADRLGHTVQELRKTYAHVYDQDRASMISILNQKI